MIKDFVKEIEVMFDIYTDEIEIRKIKKKLIKKLGKRKILIMNKSQNV